MAFSQRSSTDHGPAADELNRSVQLGSDALNAGRLTEAREQLERAIAQQPKNQKVQSLLGLTSFKLGNFDRASELYASLVRENPVEPALRVNLGLVYLKMGSVAHAIKELQTAVDLAPEHRKAQSYLGLALAQAGDHSRAREAFAAAGSTSMVEKMDQALHAAQPIESGNGSRRQFTELEGAEGEGERDSLDSVSVGAMNRGAQVADLAQALKLAPSQAAPFEVHGGLVGIRVAGEVLTRLENLVAISGQVALTPEVKRFRGRATDKPFGKGPRRFARATGQGLIWTAPAGRMFLPLDLGENAFYFAEERLFAFEEPLTFENGRLPGKNAPDLNLVHLRGHGKVLVAISGPLRSVEVAGGRPSVIAIDYLVGWMGSVTPKIVSAMAEPEAESPSNAVELTGDGFALVCLPESS